MSRGALFFLSVIALLAAGSAQAASGGNGSTQELAGQSRQRITIYPRRHYVTPNSKRICRAWLAKEYRVSGPVIVPREQCYWQ